MFLVALIVLILPENVAAEPVPPPLI